MKTLLLLLTLGYLSFAGNSQAQINKIAFTKTVNDKTGMTELCKNFFMYNNSENQTRTCLIGQVEGENFHVSHVEENGRLMIYLYLPNELSRECKNFGYNRAYYKKAQDISQESKNRIRLQDENQFFALSDVACIGF